MANPLVVEGEQGKFECEMKNYPPEYVYRAMQIRKKLINILKDKIKFCLADPIESYQECMKLL